MSDYKAIKGIGVKSVAGDPTGLTGHVWYDSDANAFQVFKNVGAWSAGGNVNSARGRTGNAGTQTASILVSGYTFVSPAGNIDASEEYNGVGWTEGNEVNTARRNNTCFGIMTAAVLPGGYTSTAVGNVEEYNGTSWSEVEDIPNEGKFGMASAGTLTAGLAWSGYILSPDVNVAETLEYDGTDWTDTSDTNDEKYFAIGMGTQTAGLSAGSESPARSDSEEYNGTGWTEGNNLNDARGAGGGAGTQTAAMIFGGEVEVGSTAVEEYNGTTWSTGTVMSITRESFGGCGTNTAALAGSGTVTNNSNPANTEEYSFAASAVAITSS